MFPEAQRKAQAELDAVVGPDRLPDFADQKSLPYVSALMKEVLRWHVVAPIGVPHRSTEADEYGGYYLPGGSLIIVNQWFVYSSLTVSKRRLTVSDFAAGQCPETQRISQTRRIFTPNGSY